MNDRVRQLRNKPLGRSLVALSLPLMATSLLQSAFQLTDTFWVGRLGATALAAVAVNVPILVVIVALGGGAATAGFILVAQWAGAGDRAMVAHVSRQSLLLVLTASFVLGTAGYVLGPQLLSLPGVAPETHTEALRYLRPLMLGVPFMFTQICVQSLMRGLGEVRLPMALVLLSVLLNLVLDPILIFGWGPIPAAGVAGAACATVTTQCVAALLGAYFLFGSGSAAATHGQRVAPDLVMIRKLLRLGARGTVEQSARGFGMMAMMVLVTGFGTATVAAYGVVSRVVGLIMVPAMSLSMAAGTLIGHSIGAADVERARKVARTNLAVLFGGLALCGALVFGFAESIVRVFVPDDAALLRDATGYLRILSPFFAVAGVQIAFIGTFRGAGDMVAAMLLALCAVWAFELPIAWALTRFTPLGAAGIWWAYPAADVLAASLAFLMYRRRQWHDQQLLAPDRSKDEASSPTAVRAVARR